MWIDLCDTFVNLKATLSYQTLQCALVKTYHTRSKHNAILRCCNACSTLATWTEAWDTDENVLLFVFSQVQRSPTPHTPRSALNKMNSSEKESIQDTPARDHTEIKLDEVSAAVCLPRSVVRVMLLKCNFATTRVSYISTVATTLWIGTLHRRFHCKIQYVT